MVDIEVLVNGTKCRASVPAQRLLVHFLRDDLRLTGAHVGCEVGRCGACTVVLDGQPVKSCMVLAAQADGRQVTTVEGLAQGEQLHPLQQAFWECDAAECGYCTPGMIMSLYALFGRSAEPTDGEVLEALGGNLCRCTGYVHILEAAGRARALLSQASEDKEAKR